MKTILTGYEPLASGFGTERPLEVQLLQNNVDSVNCWVDLIIGEQKVRVLARQLAAAVRAMEEAHTAPSWTVKGLYGPNSTFPLQPIYFDPNAPPR